MNSKSPFKHGSVDPDQASDDCDQQLQSKHPPDFALRCDRCQRDLPSGAFTIAINYEQTGQLLPKPSFGCGSSATFRLCVNCTQTVAMWVTTQG